MRTSRQAPRFGLLVSTAGKPTLLRRQWAGLQNANWDTRGDAVRRSKMAYVPAPSIPPFDDVLNIAAQNFFASGGNLHTYVNDWWWRCEGSIVGTWSFIQFELDWLESFSLAYAAFQANSSRQFAFNIRLNSAGSIHQLWMNIVGGFGRFLTPMPPACTCAFLKRNHGRVIGTTFISGHCLGDCNGTSFTPAHVARLQTFADFVLTPFTSQGLTFRPCVWQRGLGTTKEVTEITVRPLVGYRHSRRARDRSLFPAPRWPTII